MYVFSADYSGDCSLSLGMSAAVLRLLRLSTQTQTQTQVSRSTRRTVEITAASLDARTGAALNRRTNNYRRISFQFTPSNRQHISCDDFLEDKREDNENGSLLCCVHQLCTLVHTHIHTPVSYTHLPSPRDGLLSRMPSSA